jgi:hypothetical protein
MKDSENQSYALRAPGSREEQLKLCALHPVVRRNYFIPSPPLKRASDLVLQRVSLRRTSCSFVAVPRFGKTHATRFIAKEIASTFPDVYVVKMVCEKIGAQRPKAFHDFVFESSGGLIERVRRDASSALMRVVRRWTIEAVSAKANHIVLIADEIQRMTPDELTYLADITNKVLDESELRITTVSFGSPEMVYLRDALCALRRQDLIGRFCSGMTAFEGLQSKDELREVMQAYDDPDVAEFPPGSGWSFSRFFFPTAYQLGWRLHKNAPMLWDALQGTAQKFKRWELGAEYWSAAIEFVLINYMDFDDAVGPVEEQVWTAAAENCGFAESLNATYFPGQAVVWQPRTAAEVGKRGKADA